MAGPSPIEMQYVPCDGCTACCHGVVILHPALGDDHTKFECDFVEGIGFKLMRKLDGSCSYLTPDGCSIWPKTPALCRAFDCRKYVELGLAASDPMRDDAIVAAGTERMKG